MNEYICDRCKKPILDWGFVTVNSTYEHVTCPSEDQPVRAKCDNCKQPIYMNDGFHWAHDDRGDYYLHQPVCPPRPEVSIKPAPKSFTAPKGAK